MFQNCYEEAFPQHSASNISWIGFIQAFPLTGLGVFTGPLYDYDYLRALVTVGSTLKVLGMILTSLCTKYWQILCSQGLLLGLGSGCLFVPSVAVLPTYFDKRERVALGVGAAGSAHSLFLTTEPHDRYPAAVATSPHKSFTASSNASPVPTPYPRNRSLSLRNPHRFWSRREARHQGHADAVARSIQPGDEQFGEEERADCG